MSWVPTPTRFEPGTSWSKARSVNHLVTRTLPDKRDTFLLLRVCFPDHQTPSEKQSTLKGKNQSTLKGKNLLPRGANSFLLEKTPFQKGGKTSSDGYLPWILFVLFRVYTAFNNLSVTVPQCIDVAWSSECSLLECCVTKISRPQHIA